MARLCPVLLGSYGAPQTRWPVQGTGERGEGGRVRNREGRKGKEKMRKKGEERERRTAEEKGRGEEGVSGILSATTATLLLTTLW